MGSPITFSGFNQIDFNVVLNAIMTQESAPLAALQSRQKELLATDTTLGQLAGRLGTLRTASDALSSSATLTSYTAASTDTSALTVSASSTAVEGRFDVKVTELARTQVTVSDTFAADTDTTVVATGGTITIGGTAVTLSGPVTLRQLVNAINANSSVGARASIVATAANENHLVLTSKTTGVANAFTIDNQLTAKTITFTDTDHDLISGDSPEDNAVDATNALVSINNIAVESTTNTVADAIPGVTLNLLQNDPLKTVVVTVTRDDGSLADRVDAFVNGYNALVKFANDQSAASNKGTSGAIGRDSLLRGLRNTLRTTLSAAHGSGTYTHLSEVGIEFTRTGELKLDRTKLTAALQADPAAVQTLFADSSTGVFGAVNDVLDDYTKTGGFVPDVRTRINDELSRLGRRMDDMAARLAIRRAALQREFTAADEAMARLNAQKGSLSSFGSTLTASSF